MYPESSPRYFCLAITCSSCPLMAACILFISLAWTASRSSTLVSMASFLDLSMAATFRSCSDWSSAILASLFCTSDWRILTVCWSCLVMELAEVSLEETVRSVGTELELLLSLLAGVTLVEEEDILAGEVLVAVRLFPLGDMWAAADVWNSGGGNGCDTLTDTGQVALSGLPAPGRVLIDKANLVIHLFIWFQIWLIRPLKFGIQF